MPSPLNSQIAVANVEGFSTACQQLAQHLNLTLIESANSVVYPYLLVYSESGLALQQTGPKAPGPIRIDFNTGASEHRRKQGGAELVIKAIAGDKRQLPTVLDMTAGLGRDSFVLASRGYRVTLCERSPIVAALLQNGLQRALNAEEQEVVTIAQRMQLMPVDVVEFLHSIEAKDDQNFDAVLIDPMFPASKKSALVKKEMQAFHQLVGADEDSDQLLSLALSVARHRVVVKRPKKAEWLANQKPNFSVEGKAIRFDIYSLKAYGK